MPCHTTFNYLITSIMRKPLFLFILAFFISTLSRADLPFRNHRYDAFKVLQVGPENIVFVGNSITNMHEWWEAFGNPLVLNRGVSGAVSDELLANLGAILPGKPAKMFFLIGTNDLGTEGINHAAHVAANVRSILARCQKESPATKLYVQGILPSRRRKLELLLETNDSIRRICNEMGVTYIDLWEELASVAAPEDFTHTLDGLHLSASGYRLWCNKIAPYVGSACVYPADAANNPGGLAASYGMRATYFAMLPVRKGDILLIGDEAVHGGEWHELLHSDRIKSRGTGWGHPGSDIATTKAYLPGIFKGRADNEEPAQVHLYIGTADVLDKAKTLEDIALSYRELLAQIRSLAPHALICVQSLLPTADAEQNAARIVPFNALLKKLAKETKHAKYVDTYSPLEKDGVANPAYFQGNYLNGAGYARLSQILAPSMGRGVKPTTEAEARRLISGFSLGQ